VDYWHRHAALSGQFPFNEELDDGQRAAVRQWAEITAKVLLDVAAMEGRLYTVQHAGDLRSQHAQAIDMLTPDDEFFGDELAPLQ